MVAPNNKDNPFSQTICSICYEDLKPIVEDLQAISICGHVFHELCLQQWFEYCKNTKKQTCPVCKQGCTKNNVGRLYFQSVGDPILSTSQAAVKDHGEEECPELLRFEVKKLENKVVGLNSALDLHQKDVKRLNSELQVFQEQLAKEVTLKNEALKQKECIQLMLQTKSSDLLKSSMECSRLQEQNLQLAKELAALKLVSDCNLEEEEIVKLASVGNDGNSKDAMDVLKKSLVIRNKSYKELMAKCNSLGRGEARSQRKLEKANEKIVKLKVRVQELEKAIEAKENEVLRSLKESKKRHSEATVPSVNFHRNTLSKSRLEDSCSGRKIELPSDSVVENSISTSIMENRSLGQKVVFPSVINLDGDEDGDPFEVHETHINNIRLDKSKVEGKTIVLEHEPMTQFVSEGKQENIRRADNFLKACNSTDRSLRECGMPRPTTSDFHEANVHPFEDQRGLSDMDGLTNCGANDFPSTKDAIGLVLQDIKQVQSSCHSKADSPIPLAEPGERCFAGGLLGPDGANRYLGKWCKRTQNNGVLGSTNSRNSLIAVGADGRGGRAKVLRSLNQTTMDTKENVISGKRLKTASKFSSSQSQGCLQIEHFFGRANN